MNNFFWVVDRKNFFEILYYDSAAISMIMQKFATAKVEKSQIFIGHHIYHAHVSFICIY